MAIVQLHLILVSFWFGLWASETVLELCGRDAASRHIVALVHGWIDLVFEGPVTVAVLVTGALLLARAWPAPPLLLVHAGLGMVPVIANLVCMMWVQQRRKETDDERARALTSKVKLSGLAIPVAIVAMVMGLGFMSAG